MDHLTALFQEMWRQGEVPQDFKDATIVHLYKRKGNRQVCDNHRGISLLNIAGKIFARILLNHLNNHLEQEMRTHLYSTFVDLKKAFDTVNREGLWKIMQKFGWTHLYSTFVDLTKAFDTVNCEGLWKIMQKFGCPERFTQMVRQLHDGMMARVTDNGAVSEAFAVTNGVKQGCVLAPTLFSLIFSAMLMDTYRDERPGIRIAYRTDGHLLNQRRMNFQSRVSTATVHELLFADDCALNTTSEEEMQRSVDQFSAACENFSLIINTQKTMVMHQPPPNSATAPKREWDPTASGRELPVPGKYPISQHQYRKRSRQQDLESQSSLRSPPKHSLESSRSSAEHEAEDVQGRHPADATLRSRDMDGVHEAGTPTEPLPPQLSPSHPEAELAGSNPRHGSTGTNWNPQHLRHTETNAAALERPPDVATGSRRQGGQIRRYKDTLKSSLKRLQINPTNWEELARDRPTWRRTVNTGAAIYETNRIAAAKAKREARKSQLRQATVAQDITARIPDTTAGIIPSASDSRREDQEYTCPHCDRTFTSRVGLVGHLRIHRTETGEPVPGAPTYTHRTRLHCPHCPPTFTHRMGLFGHMRIHENGIDNNSDTPTTPVMPSTTLAPSVCTTINASSVADTDVAAFTCPHCPGTFTSRIGLVGHLRIHRTETGEPVPGAPTYTHQARLNCPHCPRTFRHRMGLFGHMRIHDDLR
nr:unnamed protein product [Spirometra erinaceieuropaei]